MKNQFVFCFVELWSSGLIKMRKKKKKDSEIDRVVILITTENYVIHIIFLVFSPGI